MQSAKQAVADREGEPGPSQDYDHQLQNLTCTAHMNLAEGPCLNPRLVVNDTRASWPAANVGVRRVSRRMATASTNVCSLSMRPTLQTVPLPPINSIRKQEPEGSSVVAVCPRI